MSEDSSFDIPVIDFELLKKRDETTKNRFLKAITDIGLFYLKNHDIPENLTNRLVKFSDSFYNTTAEERTKVENFEGKMATEGTVFAKNAFENSPLVKFSRKIKLFSGIMSRSKLTKKRSTCSPMIIQRARPLLA